MAVLITGGAGFLGSAVVRCLLARGESRPFVLHRSPSVQRLADVLDRVELVRGDLGNFSHVLEAVRKAKPTAIYHLGGMLSMPSEADPASAMQANVLGMFHVLEAARLFEVPQVLYSSSLAAYGMDLKETFIDDDSLQRPLLFYGATKVFGEHIGLFYKRKYGLDFRGLRYPSIVGPGVETSGVAQHTSRMIETCAQGRACIVPVTPETRVPVMYIQDAARAMIKLSEAPAGQIRKVNYLLAGTTPIPSALELADIIRTRIPDAHIRFDPDPAIQSVLDRATKNFQSIDESNARKEWGWQSEYSLERMVDAFLLELKSRPPL
ncbi:MAG: NAD-dependent epimerase/dehydratase family protein [Armatimonadetes bacterium]|nr:NAD-dependent epimerase/dehydratase family protein [Armatimonadota bacterium]